MPKHTVMQGSAGDAITPQYVCVAQREGCRLKLVDCSSNSSSALAMADAASELARYLDQHHGLAITLSPTKGRCLVAQRPFRRGKYRTLSPAPPPFIPQS